MEEIKTELTDEELKEMLGEIPITPENIPVKPENQEEVIDNE